MKQLVKRYQRRKRRESDKNQSALGAWFALLFHYIFFTLAAASIILRTSNGWLTAAIVFTIAGLYVMPLFCALLPRVPYGPEFHFRRSYHISRCIYRAISRVRIPGFIDLQLVGAGIYLACVGTVPSSWTYATYLSWFQIGLFYIGATILALSIWGFYLMPWLKEVNQLWSETTAETRSS